MASGSANHYEIRVRGHLGETRHVAFPELRTSIDGADTVLNGPLSDQAAVPACWALSSHLGLNCSRCAGLHLAQTPGPSVPAARIIRIERSAAKPRRRIL